MFPPNITTLARALLKEAEAANLHIATAESCTGELVAAALTEIEGASAVVDRGFVVYTNRAKTELLGVSQVLLKQHGAVSEEVARAMVDGALRHSSAELAVSVTGIAGPTGGTLAKPVGLVHLAAARARGTLLHEECRFGDVGRAEVRMRSVEAALKLLFQVI